MNLEKELLDEVIGKGGKENFEEKNKKLEKYLEMKSNEVKQKLEQINLDKIKMEFDEKQIKNKYEMDLEELKMKFEKQQNEHKMIMQEKECEFKLNLEKLKIEAKEKESETEMKLLDMKFKETVISKIDKLDFNHVIQLLGIEKKDIPQPNPYVNPPPFMNPQINNQPFYNQPQANYNIPNYLPQGPFNNYNQPQQINNNQM